MILLAKMLHEVSKIKPREEIAKETGIALNRLQNICAESRETEPTVEEWRRITRSVYEASPEAALSLASFAATEMFTVSDKSTSAPDSTVDAIMLQSLDMGRLSAENLKAVLDALRDLKLDTYEKADLAERIEREQARLETLKTAIVRSGKET